MVTTPDFKTPPTLTVMRPRPAEIARRALLNGVLAFAIAFLAFGALFLAIDPEDGPNFPLMMSAILASIALIRCLCEDLRLPKGPWS